MATIKELKKFIEEHMTTCNALIKIYESSPDKKTAEFEKEQKKNYKQVLEMLDHLEDLTELFIELNERYKSLRIENTELKKQIEQERKKINADV